MFQLVLKARKRGTPHSLWLGVVLSWDAKVELGEEWKGWRVGGQNWFPQSERLPGGAAPRRGHISAETSLARSDTGASGSEVLTSWVFCFNRLRSLEWLFLRGAVKGLACLLAFFELGAYQK